MKLITIMLVVAVFGLYGCATLAGTIAGPVTGPISCIKENSKHPSGASVFEIMFSPIIGMAGGFWKGLKVDQQMMSGISVPPQNVANVFDPCASGPY